MKDFKKISQRLEILWQEVEKSWSEFSTEFLEKINKTNQNVLYNTMNGVRNELDFPTDVQNQDAQRIAYVVNSDGTISVTVSAELPGARILRYDSYIEEGDYIFSCGENSLMQDGGYDCFIWDTTKSTTLIRDTDESQPGTKAHIPAGNYQVRIRLRKGVPASATPIVFKPMLRPANITDNTYVRPTLTNEELTAKLAELEAQISG